MENGAPVRFDTFCRCSNSKCKFEDGTLCNECIRRVKHGTYLNLSDFRNYVFLYRAPRWLNRAQEGCELNIKTAFKQDPKIATAYVSFSFEVTQRVLKLLNNLKIENL